MRVLFLALTLLGLATLVAQTVWPRPAKVRIAGILTGLADVIGPGKRSFTGTFDAKGLRIEVVSHRPLCGTHADAEQVMEAIVNERDVARLRLAKESKLDGEAWEKAVEKLRAEFHERKVGVCVAEGTLAVVGKKLVLTGGVRLTDHAKLDKDLPVRGAMVEGEAAPAGTAKAAFAIRNGDGLILVTGAAAGKERKGRVRAFVYLKAGEKGSLTLEATKVEEVK